MNENCLEGMACPECESEGPFSIAVTAWAECVTDDGTDGDFTDVEWSDDAVCKCVGCSHVATVRDFRKDAEPREPPKHLERAKLLLKGAEEYAEECDRYPTSQNELDAADARFIAELLKEYIDKWEQHENKEKNERQDVEQQAGLLGH